MPKNRMAGEATLENGAFTFIDGKMVPTENTKRIMEVGREFNPNLKVRPYNSVEAFGGVPVWGSGGGHYDFADNPNVIYVDPIAADTHVVAHEVGHAVAPSALQVHIGGGPSGSFEKFKKRFNPKENIHHPSNAPPRTGAAVRAYYEHDGKTALVEEASAQGFAIGLQHRLGIPYTNKDWSHVYEYPAMYAGRAGDKYVVEEIPGYPNESEIKEWKTIWKATPALIRREYDKGYNRAMYGPQ